MIKQVIVVEGKSDIARVGMAVDADMIATEGFALKKTTIEKSVMPMKKGDYHPYGPRRAGGTDPAAPFQTVS